MLSIDLGRKFEEVEKAMFIWSTSFLYSLHCLMMCATPARGDWLRVTAGEPVLSLLESEACPTCIINLSLELQLKERHFFRTAIFPELVFSKYGAHADKSYTGPQTSQLHVKAIYQPLNCEWLNQSVLSLGVDPLWSHHQPCIFRVVG